MTSLVIENLKEDKTVSKTKKPKRVPVKEQYTNLQDACRNVVHHLKRKGVNIPETSIATVGVGLPDSKTGAMVINALATVAFLLTRFSGLSHWFQRKTFHHTRDPIYQRLIVAILKGYYVPPLRVAAVADKGVVEDPTARRRLDADRRLAAHDLLHHCGVDGGARATSSSRWAASTKQSGTRRSGNTPKPPTSTNCSAASSSWKFSTASTRPACCTSCCC